MVSRHPLAVSWIICGSRGNKRTKRCHFLNPSFFFLLSNFYFCPNGAFFPFSFPPAARKAVTISHEVLLPSSSSEYPDPVGVFVITEEQWRRGRGENDDHPPLVSSGWLSICHSGERFGPRTDHLMKSTFHTTHPWVLNCCILCHFTINFSYSHFISQFLTLLCIKSWAINLLYLYIWKPNLNTVN